MALAGSHHDTWMLVAVTDRIFTLRGEEGAGTDEEMRTTYTDLPTLRYLYEPPSSVMTTTIVSGPGPSGLNTLTETKYWV